jgi:hypothetical protein
MTAGHRGLEQSVMTRLVAPARALGLDINVLLALGDAARLDAERSAAGAAAAPLSRLTQRDCSP